MHNNHGSRTHYAFLLTHNTTARSYLYPVGSLKYDAAMYINIDGGSAISGDECAIVPMVAGTYGEVTVAETDADRCPDFSIVLAAPKRFLAKNHASSMVFIFTAL